MLNVYLRSNIINITQGIKIKYKFFYLIYKKIFREMNSVRTKWLNYRTFITVTLHGRWTRTQRRRNQSDITRTRLHGNTPLAKPT